MANRRNMMKRAMTVASVAVLGLALAACRGTGATGATGGSDDGSLKIMQLTIPKTNGLDYQAGVKAAVDAINAKGGIDGHKIDYEFCSDGPAPVGDPNSTANCAAKAVQEGVTALVGSLMVFSDSAYPTLARADIPAISALGYSTPDNNNPLSYVMGSGYTNVAGEGMVSAQLGCKKAGIISQDGLPTDPEIVGSFAAGVKLGGGQVADPVLVPEGTLDFNSSVAKLKSEGVDCITDGFPATAQLQPILQAAHAAGGLKVVGPLDLLSDQTMKTLGPLAEGYVAVDSAFANAPADQNDTSVMNADQKQMMADLQKYAPEVVDTGRQAWIGYGAVKIYEAAAKKVLDAGEKVTSKSLKAALDTVQIPDSIWPALDFSQPGPGKASRVFNTKVNFFVVKNGKITAIDREAHDVGQAIKDF